MVMKASHIFCSLVLVSLFFRSVLFFPHALFSSSRRVCCNLDSDGGFLIDLNGGRVSFPARFVCVKLLLKARKEIQASFFISRNERAVVGQRRGCSKHHEKREFFRMSSSFCPFSLTISGSTDLHLNSREIWPRL
ncbi:uncharacterized protein LOC112344977 [Selaginella moellendorffii]|uniref:uncharacterized protein LOC112344977 n=1 Tax=Selaginella moellendorffii TaxID=88036 RepID=UPI000D1C5809|nr:uncharacterized protein LOC112344977 [Selaginella moellendorffii]|eukprot:XP_024526502.1 uncharacterized protein LOC112344977 [Selaginella moellendorffii]